jgi:predicted RNase H-like HicB family nuclease
MLTEYIQAAMKNAKYEILSDDGSFYGEIPGFQGVYSNAATLEECRTQLRLAINQYLFTFADTRS